MVVSSQPLTKLANTSPTSGVLGRWHPLAVKVHFRDMGWSRNGGYPECYPLVMTNIAMGFRWPIEIDGLPVKHGDFPWLR